MKISQIVFFLDFGLINSQLQNDFRGLRFTSSLKTFSSDIIDGLNRFETTELCLVEIVAGLSASVTKLFIYLCFGEVVWTWTKLLNG